MLSLDVLTDHFFYCSTHLIFINPQRRKSAKKGKFLSHWPTVFTKTKWASHKAKIQFQPIRVNTKFVTCWQAFSRAKCRLRLAISAGKSRQRKILSCKHSPPLPHKRVDIIGWNLRKNCFCLQTKVLLQLRDKQVSERFWKKTWYLRLAVQSRWLQCNNTESGGGLENGEWPNTIFVANLIGETDEKKVIHFK